MGPIGFTEKSLWNYHYSLRNSPEECSLKKSITLLTQQNEVYVSPGSAVDDYYDGNDDSKNNGNNNNINLAPGVLSRLAQAVIAPLLVYVVFPSPLSRFPGHFSELPRWGPPTVRP
jgi:hypothetical protein